MSDAVIADELEQLASRAADTRTWLRARAVILTRRGWIADHVADALGCSLRSVRQWLAAYRQGGVAALDDRPRSGRPATLAEAEHERFLARIDAGPTPEDGVCALRGEDIRRILADEFAASYSLAGVYLLLHRLGRSSLAPRPRHRKADPEAQEEFVRGLPGKIEAIGGAHPQEKVEVFFQDEARFGRKGTLTRVWAPTGTRPTAVRQTEYESLQVITAACPATGQAIGAVMPRADTATTNAFLELMSGSLEPGVHAILIWDNAGFHTSKALAVPANITLLPSPPYSPELNPVERLWHYLRSHHWSNRWYADYEALREAAVEGWRAVCLDRELVRSICAAPYLAGAKSL